MPTVAPAGHRRDLDEIAVSSVLDRDVDEDLEIGSAHCESLVS